MDKMMMMMMIREREIERESSIIWIRSATFYWRDVVSSSSYSFSCFGTWCKKKKNKWKDVLIARWWRPFSLKVFFLIRMTPLNLLDRLFLYRVVIRYSNSRGCLAVVNVIHIGLLLMSTNQLTVKAVWVLVKNLYFFFHPFLTFFLPLYIFLCAVKRSNRHRLIRRNQQSRPSRVEI